MKLLSIFVLAFLLTACTQAGTQVPQQPATPGGATPGKIAELSQPSLQTKLYACNGQKSYEGSLVLLVVDENTYSALKTKIDRMRDDIKNDLCADVQIYTVTSSARPADIRNYLTDKLLKEQLIGAIFIGNIPFRQEGVTGAMTWPSISYYSLLNVNFIDKGPFVAIDNDNLFRWPGRDQYRFIWAGVLQPPNFATERELGLQMLEQYLDRNHLYRTGQLAYDHTIYYHNAIEKQTASEARKVLGSFGRYDEAQIVLDEDVHKQLQQPHEYVYLVGHGSPTSQQPEIYSSDFKRIKSGGLFYNIVGCEVGKFDEADYLGGHYLFSGNGLAARAPNYIATVFAGTFGSSQLEHLQQGVLWGEEFTESLGDPTLRLSAQRPRFEFSYPTQVDFGTLKPTRSLQQAINVTIKNRGQQTLAIKNLRSSLGSNVFGINMANVPAYLGQGQELNVEVSVYGELLPKKSGKFEDYLLIETNQPFEKEMKIPLSVTVDALGVKYVCAYPANNSALCDRENLHNFYGGDCNKVTGRKFCERSAMDCQKTHFYDVIGQEPYEAYKLSTDHVQDCDTPFNGGRVFYVTAECCTLVPES